MEDSRQTALPALASAAAELCAERQQADLQRICEALANRRFRIADDLVRQSCNAVRARLSAESLCDAAEVCFGTILAPEERLRNAALKVCKGFLQTMSNDLDALGSITSDLWVPILRSVQGGSDAAMDALECLSARVSLSSAADPRQTVRHSIMWSNGESSDFINRSAANHRLRFGNPTPSGWDVVDQRDARERSRQNMQAVLRIMESESDVPPSTVHIDFVDEVSDGSLWSASEATHAEAPSALDDMISQLNTLSEFFVQGSIEESLPVDASLLAPRGGAAGLARSNTKTGQQQIAKLLARSHVSPTAAGQENLSPSAAFAFSSASAVAPPVSPMHQPPKTSTHAGGLASPLRETELA